MKKSALVLSGGGSRGGYEIGVWQALRELEIPIDIVTGASVGALNGAMVAQDDFQSASELWKELETHMLFDLDEKEENKFSFDFEIGGMNANEALAYAKEILLRGGAGTSGLEKLIARYIDEDKIRRSPVEFGIVTVELPVMKPHYLFTEDIPKGRLADYILASAACFPAVQAREIDGVRFVDGGYVDVMPVEMSLEKGADSIIAVYLEAAGFMRKDSLKFAEETASKLTLIKSNWDLGNFLIFDSGNSRRIMRLGYLDAMKAFSAFDGHKYTFSKGELTSHQLAGAEAAAEFFELSPEPIYSEKTLRGALAQAVSQTPSPELSDIRTIEEALQKLSRKTLILYIAKELKEKEADSIFAGRGAFKLLKEEIQAANYLLRYVL